MTVSPRAELRVVSIVLFSQGEDGLWSYLREGAEGEDLEHGEGFVDPYDAIAAFFKDVEYDPGIIDVDPTLAHYSVPVRVHPVPGPDDFQIREYAFGAPRPYQLPTFNA